MSNNNNIRGTVDINVSGAVGALGKARQAFRDLESASTTTGKQMTASQKSAAKAIIGEYAKLEAADKSLVQSRRMALTKIRELELKGIETRKQGRASAGADLKTKELKNEGISAGNTSKKQAADQKFITDQMRQQIMLAESEARITASQLKSQLALRKQVFREQQVLNRAQENTVAGLSNMRYTLYDVGRQLAFAGAGMVALGVASVGVAIQWERDFANVQRTVGGSAEQVGALRKEFVGLAQTIPVSFEELSRIGTLAGQMGIGRDAVAEFTEIVAKFGATTGVSVDDTATAFGRLNSLLPDVKNDFKKLADSVLNVGINSVATEQAILRITTQLSSIAGGAGYTSTQIIGLSGALASIGMPPELSRGVFARVFGKIGSAVSDSGLELERWGQLAGMSGEDFKRAWGKDASGTFVKIMGGLKDAGTDANATLAELGITSVRDRPSLTRLAGAIDSVGEAYDSTTGKGGLLVQNLRDADTAAGSLETQYSAIAETVASKIALVQGNIAALFDAVGSSTLGIFGSILDTVSEKLKGIADFAAGDFGWILGVAAAVAALGGVLLLMGSAAAIGFAGYIALTQAMVGMAAQAPPAGLSMAFLNTQLAATGPLGRMAVGAIKAVTVAVKALSLIGLVLLLPDLGNWAAKAIGDIAKVDDSFVGIARRYKDSWAKSSNIDGMEHTKALAESLRGMNIFLIEGQREFKDLETAMVNAVNGGNLTDFTSKLKVLEQQLGITPKEAIEKFPLLGKALIENNIKMGTAKDGTLKFRDSVTGAAIGVAELGETMTEEEQKIQDFQDAISDTSLAFTTVKGAMDKMIEKNGELAQADADRTESTTDTMEDFASKHQVSTAGFIAELQAQVDAQTVWEGNMNTLATRVSSGTLNELAKLGPEGAALIADLAVASDPQLKEVERLFAESGINAAAKYAAGLMQIESAKESITTAVSSIGEAGKAEFLAKVISGQTPYNEILASYGLGPDGKPVLKMDADTAPAKKTIDHFRTLPTVTNVLRVKTDAELKEAERKLAALRKFQSEAILRIGVDASTSTGSKTLDLWRTAQSKNTVTIPLRYNTPTAPPAPSPWVSGAGSTGGKKPFTGGMMYDGGGYTGDGGMYKPAGIVHKGEFVMTKKATANLGTSYLYNLMRAGQKGYATGGSVAQSSNSYVPSYGGNRASTRASKATPQIVELSPIDRQLLTDAGNLQFIIPGSTIAKAVSANNINSATRRKA